MIDTGDEGGPEADFIVTGHCPYMYTVVTTAEVEAEGLAKDMIIGLYGRNKRNEDAEEKIIIHVEKRRD